MVGLLRFVGNWSHFSCGLSSSQTEQRRRSFAEVGIAHFHRGLHASFDDVPAAAWRVLSSRRGGAIATESMMAVLDWADRTPRIERTVCLIHIHTTSVLPIAVAAKLRYKELARCNYREQPAFLLQRVQMCALSMSWIHVLAFAQFALFLVECRAL